MKIVVIFIFLLLALQLTATEPTEEQKTDRLKGALSTLGILTSEISRKIVLKNPDKGLQKSLTNQAIEDQVIDFLKNVKYRDQLDSLEQIEREMLKPKPYPKTIPKAFEVNKADAAFAKNFDDINELNSKISKEAKGLTQVVSAQAELGGIDLRIANMQIKSDFEGVHKRFAEQKASARHRAVKRIKLRSNVLLITYGAYMIYLTMNESPSKKREGEKVLTKTTSIPETRNSRSVNPSSRELSADLFTTKTR